MRFIAFLFVLALSYNAKSQILTVSFEHVRNSNGVFRVGFFTSHQTYKDGDPVFYKTIAKTGLNNGTLIYNFRDIPVGIYGIVVLDDENSNDKTDYSWFIPSEGFGFSNHTIEKVEVPDFDDFDFSFYKDCFVKVVFKYL